ncbi:MAG: YncE family protein, partial [Hyphomonas sp.]
ALVSEADFDDGVAFLLLDRATGETLDTRDIDAGNLLKHPNKPWLYMSFFRRNPEVQIYDMAQREIILTAPAPARLDRMVMVEASNELLVTSPVTSEILRLDADTLETKGTLKGPFGVRTLAYDPAREFLFAGSFATGQIRVIDMQTLRPLGTTYLGPWLRSIELDAENATAYVSSNGALYRWTYDHFR